MLVRPTMSAAVAGLVAAAIALPSQAQSNASETSMVIGSIALMVPFSIAYKIGATSVKAPGASVDGAKRWSVAGVRPNGNKTALELHSDDGQMKLDLAVDQRVAQAQNIQVGDRIDIDAIGTTGYVVKKGNETIALLAEPGSGMVHSAPRT